MTNNNLLKNLVATGGINFHHKWNFEGKPYEADFEVEIEKNGGDKFQISVDEIKDKNSAICLFNAEYELSESEKFIADLKSQHLEFVIKYLQG